jgi:hypothetical protein
VSFLGPYLSACCLLIVAGVLKASRPHDTANSLAAATSIPLPQARLIVRVGAAAEAAIGVAAMVYPSTLAAASVAATYVAFTAYVLWLQRTAGALASCGCFGSPDTVPTSSHVIATVALAVASSIVAAASDGRHLSSLLESQPGGGLPLILTSATCAVLAFGVLSHLARVEGARQLFLAKP